MTSSAPWWAVPASTLAGVLLTLVWSTWSEGRRRRGDRVRRFDVDNRQTCMAFQRSAWNLLDVPARAATAAGATVPVQPMLTTVIRLNEEVAFCTHRRVAEAGNLVTARAAKLVQALESIRADDRATTATTGITATAGTDTEPDPGTDPGPDAGTDPDDKARAELDKARKELDESIGRFAVLARRELGITAPYTPGWHPNPDH